MARTLSKYDILDKYTKGLVDFTNGPSPAQMEFL